MAARDRWKIAIRCPKCGRAGEVDVSQAEGMAFARNPSTSVDRLPDGFARVDEGDGAVLEFICITDRTIAEKAG